MFKFKKNAMSFVNMVGISEDINIFKLNYAWQMLHVL
jgi:hypothetical protein